MEEFKWDSYPELIMIKSISHLRGTPRRSLGKTFGNSLTTGTESIEGVSHSRSLTLITWYKKTLGYHPTSLQARNDLTL